MKAKKLKGTVVRIWEEEDHKDGNAYVIGSLNVKGKGTCYSRHLRGDKGSDEAALAEARIRNDMLAFAQAQGWV
ncbi:hypothetical protein [Stenotrophomonas sp.]|uniref:hypothetical protein n=1 Tax=Stenotrophomonas sp. TaxID=69392 RepID=UPI0028986237|nr:hypothetical protein [Stenotrophomonas sp.]